MTEQIKRGIKMSISEIIKELDTIQLSAIKHEGIEKILYMTTSLTEKPKNYCKIQ